MSLFSVQTTVFHAVRVTEAIIQRNRIFVAEM